tara:strand:- start:16443 stop:17069 length:627 start_codon:yes stop_codon:yes gene_type:complete
MALDSYSSLQSSIADWLNRSDLTNVIPDFIKLAETQLNREIRHYKMHNKATANIETQYSATPTDWLQSIRFHLNDTSATLLKQTSPEEIAKLRDSADNSKGRPQYYSHVGDLIEVFPTPDQNYEGELLYYQSIPSLGSTPETSTNWLLAMSPDAYLYGALLQASPYLQADERMGVWGSTYQGIINAINGESDNTRHSASNLQLRIRSY